MCQREYRTLFGQSDAASKTALKQLSGALISGLRGINDRAMDLRGRARARGELAGACCRTDWCKMPNGPFSLTPHHKLNICYLRGRFGSTILPAPLLRLVFLPAAHLSTTLRNTRCPRVRWRAPGGYARLLVRSCYSCPEAEKDGFKRGKGSHTTNSCQKRHHPR